MAVILNTAWQVQFSNMPEFIQRAGEAKGIHERLGAVVNAIQMQIAGPQFGRVNYLMGFEGLSQHGKFADALAMDAGWQQFAATVLAVPNPIATLVSQVLSADLPGFDRPLATLAPGSVVWTQTWRPEPGRQGEIASTIAAWFKIAERMGVETRARQVLLGGDMANTLLTATFCANMEAQAALMEALFVDAEFQALQARIAHPSAGAAQLTNSVGRVMPI